MKRFEKQELISDLNMIFSNNSSIILVHYKGINVSDMEGIRGTLRDSELGFKVIKNSLASIALQETANASLDGLLNGPIAVSWGNDPVTMSKIFVDMNKKNENLVIQGGVYNGVLLSVDEIKTLASLPSFEELRGKLVGLLTAAATKIAVISKTPATNVVGVLESYAKKAN